MTVSGSSSQCLRQEVQEPCMRLVLVHSPHEVMRRLFQAGKPLVRVPFMGLREQVALQVGQQQVLEVCCGNVIDLLIR